MWSFPGGSDSKELPAMQETWFDPSAGKIPGGGHGNPLLDSCLENPMDREDWGGTRGHGVAWSQTRLSDLGWAYTCGVWYRKADSSVCLASP